MLAHCSIMSTRISFFNASSFLKITVYSREITGYIFSYTLFFLIFSPPLVTAMLGIWMQKCADDIMCSLRMLFRLLVHVFLHSGVADYIFSLLSAEIDTFSHCVQVITTTQVNALLD